jgi:hypothetical protein
MGDTHPLNDGGYPAYNTGYQANVRDFQRVVCLTFTFYTDLFRLPNMQKAEGVPLTQNDLEGLNVWIISFLHIVLYVSRHSLRLSASNLTWTSSHTQDFKLRFKKSQGAGAVYSTEDWRCVSSILERNIVTYTNLSLLLSSGECLALSYRIIPFLRHILSSF